MVRRQAENSEPPPIDQHAIGEAFGEAFDNLAENPSDYRSLEPSNARPQREARTCT